MRIKKSQLVLIVVGLLIASFVILFLVINQPTEEELLAEQIIHSYIESKGLSVRQGTDDYKILMRKIIWGEVPELTEIGAGYINNQEELEYVASYAWEFSGYKDAYGYYREPDREEAKLPTSTEQPTNEGEQIIATATETLISSPTENPDTHTLTPTFYPPIESTTTIEMENGLIWTECVVKNREYAYVWPDVEALSRCGDFPEANGHDDEYDAEVVGIEFDEISMAYCCAMMSVMYGSGQYWFLGTRDGVMYVVTIQ